jgi:hypothetical protein
MSYHLRRGVVKLAGHVYKCQLSEIIFHLTLRVFRVNIQLCRRQEIRKLYWV